jgi:hypothetical protein
MEAIDKDAAAVAEGEDPEFADTGASPPLPVKDRSPQDTRTLATEDTAEVRLAGVAPNPAEDEEGPAVVAGDLGVDEDADTPLPEFPADDGDTEADPGTDDDETASDASAADADTAADPAPTESDTRPDADDDVDSDGGDEAAVAADDGKA